MNRSMPPEWAPHKATWMGFPRGAYPEAGVTDSEAQNAWASVANVISEIEPLHMLCDARDLRLAQRQLSQQITLHETILNDAWLRDIGPTFVIESDALIAVDWQFNGWGQHSAFDWAHDALAGQTVAQLAGVPCEVSTLTNEGGGLHVDGEGTVLLTRTVQLDPDRNPGWSIHQVEAEIHARLGTHTAIWLPRGLYRDYLDNGTRGHIDMIASFTPDGRVLVHQQTDPAHPDQPLFEQWRRVLTDHGLDVLALPAPTTVRDRFDWVDYSYTNHYVLNGAVICPTFADKNDDQAREILSDCYPDREIVCIEARTIFALGGGVHCITQQQPAVRTGT